MKVQLHQRHALHVPAFDVMNAADIEEVVLVIVREQSFHLRRIHAAIRLADIDHRQIQARKDVDLHFPEGQQAAHADRHDRHHHGDRPSQG